MAKVVGLTFPKQVSGDKTDKPEKTKQCYCNRRGNENKSCGHLAFTAVPFICGKFSNTNGYEDYGN